MLGEALGGDLGDDRRARSTACSTAPCTPDRVPKGPDREAMPALTQQASLGYERKDLLTLPDLDARLDSQDELQALRRQLEEAQDSLNALSNRASGRHWITRQRKDDDAGIGKRIRRDRAREAVSGRPP